MLAAQTPHALRSTTYFPCADGCVGGGVHRKSSFSKSQELYSVWCVFLKIAPPGFAVIIMFCFTMVLAGTCHSCISCGCTISRRPKFCTTHTHEACQLQALEAAPLLATTCLQTRLKPSATTHGETQASVLPGASGPSPKGRNGRSQRRGGATPRKGNAPRGNTTKKKGVHSGCCFGWHVFCW